MARELKFRAWDGIQMIYQTNALSDIQRFFRVIREDAIVMQFTGLLDKNGKEIYEGDIVHYDTEDGIVMAKIVFEMSEEENANISEFKFEFICHEDYVNEDEGVDLEVIGNIYENPELIKC